MLIFLPQGRILRGSDLYLPPLRVISPSGIIRNRAASNNLFAAKPKISQLVSPSRVQSESDADELVLEVDRDARLMWVHSSMVLR